MRKLQILKLSRLCQDYQERRPLVPKKSGKRLTVFDQRANVHCSHSSSAASVQGKDMANDRSATRNREELEIGKAKLKQNGEPLALCDC